MCCVSVGSEIVNGCSDTPSLYILSFLLGGRRACVVVVDVVDVVGVQGVVERKEGMCGSLVVV